MTGPVNAAGLSLLRTFEQGPGGGPALVAYACPAGVATIGWGHTGADVTPGLRVTAEQAEALLAADLVRVDAAVAALLTRPAAANERAAMVCLAFNIGCGAKGFAGSTVLKRHNAGDPAAAARAFLLWDKIRTGGRLTVSPGLVRRRSAEMALYLTPDDPMPLPAALPQAVVAETPVFATRTAIAGGIGGAMVLLQQAVAQLQPVWTGLRDAGLSPPAVLAIIGGVALAATAVVLVERLRRRREGRA
jgi:lysozyme